MTYKGSKGWGTTTDSHFHSIGANGGKAWSSSTGPLDARDSVPYMFIAPGGKIVEIIGICERSRDFGDQSHGVQVGRRRAEDLASP
jgi:hypothetical protein